MQTRKHSAADRRIEERDAGLRRLRRATVLVLAAAGALSAAFGELAAKAFPGRSGTTTTLVTVRASGHARSAAPATPPPLVSAGSPAPAASAPAPTPAPVQTQAPPVVVSGGT